VCVCNLNAARLWETIINTLPFFFFLSLLLLSSKPRLECGDTRYEWSNIKRDQMIGSEKKRDREREEHKHESSSRRT